MNNKDVDKEKMNENSENNMGNENINSNMDNSRVEPVLLINVKDSVRAGMLETLLTEANIPVLRKYPETGQYLQILMGASIYGADLYVPAESLEMAKSIIEGIEGSKIDSMIADSDEPVFDIRPMCIEDYQEVFRLWERTPGVGLRSIDDSKESIQVFLKKNPTTCFVAETDRNIAGCIISGHDGRRGHIYHTVVAEEYRRNNIGRALVESVIQSMKKEGVLKLSLVTFSDNAQAQTFWESLNWMKREDLIYYDLCLNEENK